MNRNIKVTEHARELYARNCSVSTMKCESFDELDYKIKRAVELGKKVKSCNDGTYLIQYYNNQIHISKNEILNIQKTKKCEMISEQRKEEHYNRTYKVLV